MKKSGEFLIPFVGLKEGQHLFDYVIDDSFFEDYIAKDFEKTQVNVEVSFLKKTTLFELEFKCSGTVEVICDTSGEVYQQEISGSFPLIIKFGKEFNDEDDEILIIPHEYYQVNIKQYIYELIVLAIPQKRVHPKVLSGEWELEVGDKIQEASESNQEDENTIDPRWNQLKNLLENKQKK